MHMYIFTVFESAGVVYLGARPHAGRVEDLHVHGVPGVGVQPYDHAVRGLPAPTDRLPTRVRVEPELVVHLGNAASRYLFSLYIYILKE